MDGSHQEKISRHKGLSSQLLQGQTLAESYGDSIAVGARQASWNDCRAPITMLMGYSTKKERGEGEEERERGGITTFLAPFLFEG